MEYLALLLPVCLCWRTRHLLAVTTAAALIIAAAGSRGGTASLVYLIPVLAVTFVLSYRLGNAGGWRRTIAGPALLAVTAEVVNPGFNPLLLMVTFGPWAAGEFVRSRRRLAAELAEAGELLEAERSRYADEAVRYERVHLARELHDTVAHWLTAVVIQARAGQVRSLTRQESMAATFADIVTAAGRADEEITRAAALLGRDGTSPDSLLELADDLVDAVRATGTDVTFRRAGQHVLSPAVAADALRIIQEGLTNSMKHAPGAPVSVTLEVAATGLNVDIVNGPARSAPLELDGRGGAGLLGMTERVKAHGGQLSAGPVPGGGWRVAATLPSGTHLGLLHAEDTQAVRTSVPDQVPGGQGRAARTARCSDMSVSSSLGRSSVRPARTVDRTSSSVAPARARYASEGTGGHSGWCSRARWCHFWFRSANRLVPASSRSTARGPAAGMWI
jgi:signal transduction histidine kinase